MIADVADTLKADTAMLNEWRGNAGYDYAREIMQPDFSLREWIMMQIDRALNQISGSGFYTDNATAIWITVAVALLLAVIAFVLRNKLRFFNPADNEALQYKVAEDTIYGVDFQAEIEAAMACADYNAAVRYIYLYVLKNLADDGRIDWQPYKTPAQYVREAGTPAFMAFSTHFQRVRYGGFAADEKLVAEMQRLRKQIAGIAGAQDKGGGQ